MFRLGLVQVFVAIMIWLQPYPGSVVSAAEPSPQPLETTASSTNNPLHHSRIFQPGDRVLFVGDQVTQTFTYPRAFATAMLSIRPHDKLRFINGGYDGATITSALTWIDDLLSISQPQVVFIAMGINDLLPATGSSDDPSPSAPLPDLAELESTIPQNLGLLVERVKAQAGVRSVILLGPSATQPGVSTRVDSTTLNPQLRKLSEWVMQTARQHQVNYIDMTEFSQAIYEQASQTDGEPLTFDGVRPNELGGVVLASIILKGLQVEARELEAKGWSPIAPRKMARVRSGLALELKAPSLEQADRSRALYDAMLPHEQIFFRAWRLAGKSPSAGSREDAQQRADNAWSQVDRTASELFVDQTTTSKP